MEDKIIHLLKPKEFRVWCLPDRAPSTEMNITASPSKANCGNCLTAFRTKVTGRKNRFEIQHTVGRKTYES